MREQDPLTLSLLSSTHPLSSILSLFSNPRERAKDFFGTVLPSTDAAGFSGEIILTEVLFKTSPNCFRELIRSNNHHKRTQRTSSSSVSVIAGCG